MEKSTSNVVIQPSDVVKTLAMHNENTSILNEGMDLINRFDCDCPGNPGNGGCKAVSNLFKDAFLILINYKRTGPTDGINAENLRGLAKTMYMSCVLSDCDKTRQLHADTKQYMKRNNLMDKGE